MKKLSDYHALLFSLLIIMGSATAGTMIMPIAQLLMPNWQVSNAVSSDVVDGATVEAVFSNLDANVKTVITNTGSDLFYSISNPSNYISGVEFEGFFARSGLTNEYPAAAGVFYPTYSASAEQFDTMGAWDYTDGIFTPTVPGVYMINVGIQHFEELTTNVLLVVSVEFDDGAGSIYYAMGEVIGSGNFFTHGSALIRFDGVDDSVRVAINHPNDSVPGFSTEAFGFKTIHFGASLQGIIP